MHWLVSYEACLVRQYMCMRACANYNALIRVVVFVSHGVPESREMNALEQCVHPNIVALLERQELESGRPVMVLELLKCTLEQYFDNHKSFITGNTFKAPVKYVEKWSYELAQALQFIHGHAPKIIHRDIKPHNVMLDFDLNCKISTHAVSFKFYEVQHDKQETSILPFM